MTTAEATVKNKECYLATVVICVMSAYSFD